MRCVTGKTDARRGCGRTRRQAVGLAGRSVSTVDESGRPVKGRPLALESELFLALLFRVDLEDVAQGDRLALAFEADAAFLAAVDLRHGLFVALEVGDLSGGDRFAGAEDLGHRAADDLALGADAADDLAVLGGAEDALDLELAEVGADDLRLQLLLEL